MSKPSERTARCCRCWRLTEPLVADDDDGGTKNDGTPRCRVGYLFKKGGGKSAFGRRSWKLRFFVLDATTLCYFKAEVCPLLLSLPSALLLLSCLSADRSSNKGRDGADNDQAVKGGGCVDRLQGKVQGNEHALSLSRQDKTTNVSHRCDRIRRGTRLGQLYPQQCRSLVLFFLVFFFFFFFFITVFEWSIFGSLIHDLISRFVCALVTPISSPSQR